MFLFIIIIGTLTYGIYNNSILLNDMYYYSQMKMEEYMGLYSYDDYEEDDIYKDDNPIMITESTDSGSDSGSDSDSDSGSNDSKSIEYFTENSILTVVVNDFISQLQQKCIGLYFELLKVFSLIENKWNTIVYNYAFLTCINKIFTRFWNKIRRFTCRYSIEPDESEWINNIVFYRIKNENCTFSYNIQEKYMMFSDDSLFGCIFGNHCFGDSIRTRTDQYIKHNREKKLTLKRFHSMPSYIFQQMEFIVMTKCIDEDKTTKYIVSLSSLPSNKLLMSKAKFMSIDYTHPLMNESIPLELPSEMMVAGNEILSSGFVLRALKHQSRSYVFDTDYIIKVVDGMVNMFELKYEDYIVLTDIGYCVKSH